MTYKFRAGPQNNGSYWQVVLPSGLTEKNMKSKFPFNVRSVPNLIFYDVGLGSLR
jgi:hypothetical protein